jgi:HlyD family secretion protein
VNAHLCDEDNTQLMEFPMFPKTSLHVAHKIASADYRKPAIIGFSVVMAAFGGLGGFAALAPLDSAAIAQGQIEVDSHRKSIQHLEGGIVKEILVREAEVVKAGQVLFRLEPVQAKANAEMLRNQFDAALAQEARLLAELDGASRVTFPHELKTRGTSADVMANEERQFLERRRSLESQMRILETRIEQTAQEIKGRTRQENAMTGQIGSIETELTAVEPLAQQGLYPLNRLLALKRDKLRLEGELGQTRADIERMSHQQDEARLQIEQLQQKFHADAAHDLADARGRLSDVREKLSIAGDVLTRVDIRAPLAGVVQNLRVAGIGAVVKGGDTIADLVPTGDNLVIAAQVSPLDVDSVMSGQKAEIRFTTFSSRRVPAVFGHVESVSADAIYNDTSKQSYYLARVVVDPANLPSTIATKLLPGMPAEILIATGERTVMDYLVGPLANALVKGMRER